MKRGGGVGGLTRLCLRQRTRSCCSEKRLWKELAAVADWRARRAQDTAPGSRRAEWETAPASEAAAVDENLSPGQSRLATNKELINHHHHQQGAVAPDAALHANQPSTDQGLSWNANRS